MIEPKDINILVGCEESQVVTIAFRERGFNAFSCDIQDCSGGHPEWHLKMDVFEAIKLKDWHLGIFHPPCTYLSSVQTFLCRKNPLRTLKRIKAAEFFMKLYIAPIDFVCLENPTGVMTHIFNSADQIIHPFYFGGKSFKRTSLWLKNLPKLIHNKENTLFENKTHEKPNDPKYSYIQKSTGKLKNVRDINIPFLDSKIRSKINPFIAKAMGDQWGDYLLKELNNG